MQKATLVMMEPAGTHKQHTVDTLIKQQSTYYLAAQIETK